MSDILAVDFGTSNSAAAVLGADGRPQPIAIEDGEATLPTAVFFPEDGRSMRIGRAAAKALTEGEEGRYMRALKSVLGTSLFHETRIIGQAAAVACRDPDAVPGRLRESAEAQTGRPMTRVLSGRPVHFHSRDHERDTRAEADLRGCYAEAGFARIEFLPEPEAAAWAASAAGGGSDGAPGSTG